MDKRTKFEDALMALLRKKWSWTGHIMRKIDKRWTEWVTERELRNYEEP